MKTPEGRIVAVVDDVCQELGLDPVQRAVFVSRVRQAFGQAQVAQAWPQPSEHAVGSYDFEYVRRQNRKDMDAAEDALVERLCRG